MKYRLNNKKGWLRLGLILTVLWIVIGNIIYISGLNSLSQKRYGNSYLYSWEKVEAITQKEMETPEWIDQAAEDYIEKHGDSLIRQESFFQVKSKFNIKGYMSITILPIVMSWALAFILFYAIKLAILPVIKWVVDGFK